jgi:hypothetical protein
VRRRTFCQESGVPAFGSLPSSVPIRVIRGKNQIPQQNETVPFSSFPSPLLSLQKALISLN